MSRQVAVAIIGGGSAGFRAAAEVARHTDDFVIINEGHWGTTCASVGCMPSKALIQPAAEVQRQQLLATMGLGGGELAVDGPAVMRRVRSLRDRFVGALLPRQGMFPGKVLAGRARFVEPQMLEVDGQRIQARRVIIATGSQPMVPPAWRELGGRVLISDQVFELDQPPARLAVIGLGAIGLELGQALSRLGTEVIGIEATPMIGGLSDPEVNRLALELIGREFKIITESTAELEADGDGLLVSAGGDSFTVDKALACLGRRPALAGLGLERLGLELDQSNGLPHDPATMQVADLPIFLAGDAGGGAMLFHQAVDDGKIAGFNACQERPRRFARKPLLAIAFTDPNLVQVGARWDELDQQDVVVGSFGLDNQGRALIQGQNHGMVRLYFSQPEGLLLGGTLLAPAAEHLGHWLHLCLSRGLSAYDLIQQVFYHPTLEEALQGAIYDALAQLPAREGGIPEVPFASGDGA